MMYFGPDLAQFAGEDDENLKDPEAATTPCRRPTRPPPPIGRIDVEGDKENQEAKSIYPGSFAQITSHIISPTSHQVDISYFSY